MQVDLFSQSINRDLSLLVMSTDGKLVIDQDGVIIACNHEADRLLARKTKSLYKTSLIELIPPKHNHTEELFDGILFYKNIDFRIRSVVDLLERSNTRIKCQFILSFVDLDNNHYAIITLRDISENVQLKEALAHTENIFHKTIEKLAVGACHLSLGGRFLLVNKNICRFLGVSKKHMLNSSLIDFMHPDDTHNMIVQLEQLLSGTKDCIKSEVRYKHAVGHYVWTQLTISIVRDRKHQPDYILAIVEDICSRKIFEKLLRESEQKFRTIVESISDDSYVFIANPGLDEIQSLNHGYRKIWGEDIVFSDSVQFIMNSIHDEDRDFTKKQFFNGSTQSNIGYRIVNPKGETHYVRQNNYLIRDSEDDPFIVGVIRDVTKEILHNQELEDAFLELHKANKRLTILSRTDPLTKLLNRQTIQEETRKELSRFKRYQSISTLLFIDLSEFKSINDTYGHIAGDLALQFCAKTLLNATRHTDSVGRFGGDEFIVLLPNTKEQGAQQVVNKITGTHSSFQYEGHTIEVKMSIGICEAQKQFDTEKDWFSLADEKMYMNKKASKRKSQEVR